MNDLSSHLKFKKMEYFKEMDDDGNVIEDDFSTDRPKKVRKSSLTSTIQDERNRKGVGYEGDTTGSANYRSQSVRRKSPERTNRKDILQKKEECRKCRQSIIRNWKNLKKYVYPVELLEKLCEKKLLRRENFEDMYEMDRSLALDRVLTACYRIILTQNQFDIMKAAVKDVNPGAVIEWDTSDYSKVPFDERHVTEQFVLSNNLISIRPMVERIVKGEVAINIKDDFLIYSVISIDEHEQITKDLRENARSSRFIQMIFDKVENRSLECLNYSLQQFNEKQEINRSNIRALVNVLCGISRPSDSTNTRCTVKMIQCSANPPKEAFLDFKAKLNLCSENEPDQSYFDLKAAKKIENMTSHFVRVLGSYPTRTEKGSVIIYLKSLDNDFEKKLVQSLIDDSFVGLLEKMFNDRDIQTSLSKGKYNLEVTIEPCKEQVLTALNDSECLPVNEMRSPSNLLSANRSFLIDQINVVALMKAFASTKKGILEKFDKAGINKAIEITKKAEIFLDVIEKEGLQEAFLCILQDTKMTYVLKRLQTYKKVCSSDYFNLRRNIIHKFERLVNSLDIDDLKDTFIGRKVFDIPTFDRLEEKFENNREQATAAVLIQILKSGHAAVVTLVDSLYINAMDSLADELLAPIEWSDSYEQDADMELRPSRGLMFEGTFQVIVEKYNSSIYFEEDEQYQMKKEKKIEIAEDILEQTVQKERENFYRHSTVVLDLSKNALAMLLKNELSKQGVKFSELLASNQHDIYHCVYTNCCRCQNYIPKIFKEFSLSMDHLEIIFNKKGIKLAEHRHGNFPPLCCNTVNYGLTIDELDYVLLKFFLACFELPFYVDQAIDTIETCRNESFYKADVARLESVKYLEFKTEIQNAILTVCRYCNTELEMMEKLKDVMLKPLDMTFLYRCQKTILDAVEEITDVKIRNQVEEKVGVVEFQTSLSEEDCKQFCRNFYEQKKDELISFQAELEKSQPRNLGKRYFHHKIKRGSKQ